MESNTRKKYLFITEGEHLRILGLDLTVFFRDESKVDIALIANEISNILALEYKKTIRVFFYLLKNKKMKNELPEINFSRKSWKFAKITKRLNLIRHFWHVLYMYRICQKWRIKNYQIFVKVYLRIWNLYSFEARAHPVHLWEDLSFIRIFSRNPQRLRRKTSIYSGIQCVRKKTEHFE